MITNNNGFTLVEALVALTILLVGVLAVAAMQITAVKHNKISKEIMEEIRPQSDDSSADKGAQQILEEWILQDAGDYSSSDYKVDGLTQDLQISEIDVFVKKHGITVEKSIPYLKSEIGMSDTIK